MKMFDSIVSSLIRYNIFINPTKIQIDFDLAALMLSEDVLRTQEYLSVYFILVKHYGER